MVKCHFLVFYFYRVQEQFDNNTLMKWKEQEYMVLHEDEWDVEISFDAEMRETNRTPSLKKKLFKTRKN